jgi:hypothetical protein
MKKFPTPNRYFFAKAKKSSPGAAQRFEDFRISKFDV